MPLALDEEWQALSQEVGETLLDVERTFLNLVDQQALGLVGDPNVASYKAAVVKLEIASLQMLRHMILPEESSTFVKSDISFIEQARQLE